MKLVHINLNEGILVDAINCTEWVIESPEYFSEYVMELAGQVEEKSIIIDLKGNTKEFTASTQDWINEILGVTGYDKREKGNEYSWPKAD